MCLILLTIPLVISLNYQKQNIKQYAQSSCQKIIIPAYIDPSPTTLWDPMVSVLPAGSMIIADPADGPGASVDQNYVTAINNAKAKGFIVAGYVTSSYKNQSLATVESQIDQWNQMYGVTDIFIDEVTEEASNIQYYADLYNYIKGKNASAIVIINPGIPPDEGYMAVADIVSIFEDTYTMYTSYQMPTWASKYPATRFLHLIHTTDEANMQAALSLSRQHNVGYVYVTNDVLDNPWDTLPNYWTNEIADINNNCSQQTSVSPNPSNSVPTITVLPSYYCAGSSYCVTSITPTIPTTTTVTPIIPTGTPIPSTTVEITPTIDPCMVVSQVATGSKQFRPHPVQKSNFMQLLMNFFLMILNYFLQLLNLQPLPTTTPDTSIIPSPTPTINPCPSQTPTIMN
jgi:hypothetical protein